jgi:arginyl-tRNA synthetase
MFTFPIELALSAAFSRYHPDLKPVLSLQNSQFGSDHKTASVLQLAGALKRAPLPLAEEIASGLGLDGVASVSVTGAGFLNFTLDDGYIGSCATAAWRSTDFGVGTASRKEKVVIDSGGPNVAKQLHVGHLRSFVIGESLRRILAAVGHDVVSDIHYGDWGLQIGKLVVGMKAEAVALGMAAIPPDLTLEDLGRFYASGNAACKADPEALADARAATLALQNGDVELTALWRLMREVSLDAIRGQIALLSAHFDEYGAESDAQPLIECMLERLLLAGILVEDGGALVAHVTEDGSYPPVILRKSDGAALYATTDLATIMMRIARHAPDRIVYCMDGRQALHVGSLFKLAEIARAKGVEGFAGLPALDFADFGTVKGKDGKPYSTRDGGSFHLSDLLSQATEAAAARMSDDVPADTAVAVAMAAVKFADLSTDRRGGYVFDIDKMVSFTGKTGPYLQYACARVTSLMRKARDQGMRVATDIEAVEPLERSLLVECLKLPAAVHAAAATLQPKEVCEQAYLVAQAVARVYNDLDVLDAEDGVRANRLAILDYARGCIGHALHLVGIEVPDRM